MSDEKIERIKKLESLLSLWEERWKEADKKHQYDECNRILRKEINPLRKQLQKEYGEKVSMRDRLKIGGMDDKGVSAISQNFLKMLLAVDYIADVSAEIKSKLKSCGVGSTDVSEEIDRVAQAAQAVGDKAVGHKKLRETSIAMLLSNNDDLLEKLDRMLDEYINSSLTMYNEILNEELESEE